MTITEIRQLLESPYNQKEWKVFLQSHFTNGKLFGDAHSIELMDKTISKKCYSLGNYEVNEYTKIGIFEVQLNDNVKLTRNRVGLRNLIKSITQQVAGAMVVFVQGDKWRFSYISKRKVKNKETDTIEDKETAPKRYTYLFGKNEKALTAAIRFDKLIQKQQGNIFQFLTLNDFEEAFSVEKLSKDFFNEYKKSYEDFVQFLTGKRYTKKGNKYTEQIIQDPDPQLAKLFKGKDKEREARDFVKRMLGRIVFLYFIQKKGWMAVPQGKTWGDGNHDYLFDLFKHSKNKSNFYTKELVPLFFTTLNNTHSEDETNALRFPYLNGGLFDDSQDKIYNDLKLPEEIFNSLFDTFNNFNFTVHEDAPDEHTVAVDPEMLGHIFENLLEDNKEKGAFYTPKEIVHYMCQESLAEHLTSKFDSKQKETLIKLIQQVELDQQQETWAKQNATEIILALEKIKICDPAIGSGAFPMGLLQEIFNLMVVLHDYKGWGKKNEVEIKKHIIQESIYGVDLDAGAVDIARLRFWLSLVVDETKPQALPNLDYKIMQGNSLLGIPFNTVINVSEYAKIEVFKEQYFAESTPEVKADLKQQINTATQNVLATHNQFSNFKVEFDFKLFFSEVFHGINDGFDIVIGNPPYVSTKNISDADKKAFLQLYGFADDLYYHFIIKGFELLKPNGINTMITPDTYFTTLTKKQLRNKLTTNKLCSLLHLGHDVFEEAMVSTAIFIAQKNEITQNETIVIDARGKKELSEAKYYTIPQSLYTNSINGSFFMPNETNLKIHNKLAKQHKAIIDTYWNKISTSRDIEKNKIFLNKYRENLKEGDFTIIGLVTEGGQGMATANNGKFVGIKEGTKEADRIRETRINKLQEVNQELGTNYKMPTTETEIVALFDEIKLEHGRDIFGQGYLYRIVALNNIAEVTTLTSDEKNKGIAPGKPSYVPYDKGDRDGNRWYLPTPYYIDWSIENVKFLKTNSGKKGEGMPVVRNPQFYFRYGFCWNNNLNENYLSIKCRLKSNGVHDVASMSMFSLIENVVPEYYIVSLINSTTLGLIYRNFTNNTVNVQMNDIRTFPIPVPTKNQLATCKKLFEEAVILQQDFFAEKISTTERDQQLLIVQNKVDAFVSELYNL